MKFNMAEESIFIIPSVIYFKKRPLSYTNTRSIYSPEERAAQTAESINSVRKYSPSSKIMLVEIGLDKEIPCDLASIVDAYVYLGDNFFVRKACDSKFKALGESLALFIASFRLSKHYNLIFKLSGRYFLNGKFNFDDFVSGEFNAKIFKDIISTRLYSFRRAFINRWRVSLFVSMVLSFLNISLEKIMYHCIGNRHIKNIDTLGLEGVIGPNGEKIIE